MRTLLFCLFMSVVALVAQLFGFTLSESLFVLSVCPTVVDRLRMRVEDLGPTLHHVASWLDPWLNIVPRDVYPQGAGLARSTFTIGRSYPTSDEETWDPIVVTSGETYIGSCGENYAPVDVGYKERIYAPESKGLVGPLQCVDDFTINWESASFWSSYMQALQKRTQYTISNRLANIYMNLVPKAAAAPDFHYVDGNQSTVMPSAVDLSGVDIPGCGLIQDYLDATALELMQAGATAEDSNGWINLSDNGPIFPLLIGATASKQLIRQDPTLRDDVRYAFEGMGDGALLLKRLGASLIFENFRHVITIAPPRWKVVGGALVRVPTYIMTTGSGEKGSVGKFNPDFLDPTIAQIEGAIVLNPWVFTERILQPQTAMPGMNWKAQNYFGEWMFVTGNDAVIGFDDCAGIQDPLHTRGRHFGRYRHAAEPIHPEYGRLILFQRCPQVFSCVSCS